MRISVNGNSDWNDASLSAEWNENELFPGLVVTVCGLSSEATVLIQPEELRKFAKAALLCVPDQMPDYEDEQ